MKARSVAGISTHSRPTPIPSALLMMLATFWWPSLSWSVSDSDRDVEAGGYRFKILDVPAATATFASGINARGQVTGSYTVETSGSLMSGFVYSGSAFTTFEIPSSTDVRPKSINAGGTVVGDYTDNEGVIHGFIFRNGMFTPFDVPGARITAIASINDRGQITGGYNDASMSHGFIYSGGTFTALDVPGATFGTGAHSINNRGLVVGSYSDDYRGTAGWYVYDRGEIRTFSNPGAAAVSINVLGDVAGVVCTGLKMLRTCQGFLYSGGARRFPRVSGVGGDICW